MIFPLRSSFWYKTYITNGQKFLLSFFFIKIRLCLMPGRHIDTIYNNLTFIINVIPSFKFSFYSCPIWLVRVFKIHHFHLTIGFSLISFPFSSFVVIKNVFFSYITLHYNGQENRRSNLYLFIHFFFIQFKSIFEIFNTVNVFFLARNKIKYD